MRPVPLLLGVILLLSFLPVHIVTGDMYEDGGNYFIEHESDQVIWYETWAYPSVGVAYCYNLTLRECVISGEYGLTVGYQSKEIWIWNTTISTNLTLKPQTSVILVNPNVGGRIVVDHANLTTMYTVTFSGLPDGATIHGNGSGVYAPGKYDYNITCPGYYDYAGSFNISDGPLELQPDMVPIPPPNEPPVAVAGENRTVSLGYDLLVTGSKSHDDKGIVKYQWIFDCNGTEIDQKWWFYHCDMVGNFTLTLWVWDAEGLSDTDNMTVNVYDPNPPVVNDTGPVINDTPPHLNDTPTINDTVNDTVPSLNDTVPHINDTVPSLNSVVNDTKTEPHISYGDDNLTYHPPVNEQSTGNGTVPSPSESGYSYFVWIVIFVFIVLIGLAVLYIIRRHRHNPPLVVPDEIIQPPMTKN